MISKLIIFTFVDSVMFLNSLTVFHQVFVVRAFSRFSLGIFSSSWSRWWLRKQLFIFQVCSDFPLGSFGFYKERRHLSPAPFRKKWKRYEYLSATVINISETLTGKFLLSYSFSFPCSLPVWHWLSWEMKCSRCWEHFGKCPLFISGL